MSKQYDPALVTLSFRGIVITGFASGTMMEAERDERTWTKDTGAQGEVTRVRSRKKGGKITFTVQATADVNDQLSTVLILDELTGVGTGSVQLKDIQGTTLIGSDEGWLDGPPTVGYGDEGPTREWVLDCGELNFFVGGTFL